MPAALCRFWCSCALFVTLIPTTIGALLSAIGIAGMDRLVRFNVLAMSGRAVEAAGDVDTLLLDKTGTITLGNRQATEFLPLPGVDERDLADAAQLASLSDETPEGRSIVVLAKEKYGIRGRDMASLNAQFHSVLGADADQRRRCGRTRHPQGRGRCGAGLCAAGFSAHGVARQCRTRHARVHLKFGGTSSSMRSPSASRNRAARRWPSPRTAGCSGSSI